MTLGKRARRATQGTKLAAIVRKKKGRSDAGGARGLDVGRRIADHPGSPRGNSKDLHAELEKGGLRFATGASADELGIAARPAVGMVHADRNSGDRNRMTGELGDELRVRPFDRVAREMPLAGPGWLVTIARR